MKVSPVVSESNTCTLEIELTWEAAQVVYELAPVLLAALGVALRQRKDQAGHRTSERARILQASEENKARWQSMADECAAEIQRRANSPSAKSGLIRQLAAERGVTPDFLRRILRVYRRTDAKALTSQFRRLQVKQLQRNGLTQREIASQLGISARQVRNHLAAAKAVQS